MALTEHTCQQGELRRPSEELVATKEQIRLFDFRHVDLEDLVSSASTQSILHFPRAGHRTDRNDEPLAAGEVRPLPLANGTEKRR